MAVVKNIKINVDTKSAVSETDKLTKSFDKLDKEAEKTSKSVDDVASNGGAIAILDQLTGGLATRFRDAYEATKLFNLSLKGTSKALIATGVGAFVVALGLIVAYWDEIEDAIKGTTENLQAQLDITKKIQSVLKGDVALLDKQIELAELQGKSSEALQKQKIALLDLQQEQNKREQELLQNQLKRLKATSTEVSFWDSIVANVKFTLFGAQGLADVASKLSAERLQAIKDLELALTNASTEATELEIALFKINNPEREELPDAFELENGLTRTDQLKYDSAKLLTEMLEGLEVEQRQNAKESVNLQIKYRQQLQDAIIVLAYSTTNVLAAVAEEGSNLAKGVAVAQATMNTFLGVTAALAQTTDPTPGQFLRFANAAAVGIMGLINVSKILSTKPIEKSAPSSTGGGRAVAPPSFNLVEGTEGNQIANSVNASTTPPKAFVVASDVSSQESLDRNAESDGTL